VEAPPSALPGISPIRREIGWALPLVQASIVWGEWCNDSISPPVGEMPGRAEGGNLRTTPIK